MSVTSGFFNSISNNGTEDRKYSAEQFTSLFDGIILDGVFASVGGGLMVKPLSPIGSGVKVLSGRAWFDHTWTLNDEDLTISGITPDSAYDRIDAIVLDVDTRIVTRQNSIIRVTGTPSYRPEKPTLTNSVNGNQIHKQYPLAYITVKKGSSGISQSDIENCIGTTTTPFVIGPLKTLDAEEIIAQWNTRMTEFYAASRSTINNINEEALSSITEMNQTYEDALEEELSVMQGIFSDIQDYTDEQKLAFEEWFADIKDILDDDAAGNLEGLYESEEIKRILLYGFTDCENDISPDDNTITSVASDGRKLIKHYDKVTDTATTTLYTSGDVEIAHLTQAFDKDGRTITNDISYAFGGAEDYVSESSAVAAAYSYGLEARNIATEANTNAYSARTESATALSYSEMALDNASEVLERADQGAFTPFVTLNGNKSESGVSNPISRSSAVGSTHDFLSTDTISVLVDSFTSRNTFKIFDIESGTMWLYQTYFPDEETDLMYYTFECIGNYNGSDSLYDVEKMSKSEYEALPSYGSNIFYFVYDDEV